MKNKIKAISSLLMGLATACGILAGLPVWVLVVMSIATGVLGLAAGFDDREPQA